MNKNDRIHTAFVTERGIYCYEVMSFELKNIGVNYQRLINKMFSKLIGKTMEAYIDDMVIKSNKAQDHIRNANEVLQIF